MKLTRVELHSQRIALPRQRVSLTDPQRGEAIDVLALTLHTDTALTGLGFTYSLGGGASAIRALIENDFAPLVIGQNPLHHERIAARVQAAFLPSGWKGLVTRAYAAIDIGLWDLKAKAAGFPLHQLLGGARESSPAFISDLAPLGASVGEVNSAAQPWLQQGVLGIMVEVGSNDLQQDADRLEHLLESLGETTWLGVTGEQRLDAGAALTLSQFFRDEVAVDWFEDPIPPDDVDGYRRLEQRLETPLALGSTMDQLCEFRELLHRGTARVIRPDVLRLGGITPFLKIAVLAEAHHVMLAPKRLPEIGVHLACGLPNIHAVELDQRLASMFREPLKIERGRLVPPSSLGLGLEWK